MYAVPAPALPANLHESFGLEAEHKSLEALSRADALHLTRCVGLTPSCVHVCAFLHASAGHASEFMFFLSGLLS